MSFSRRDVLTLAAAVPLGSPFATVPRPATITTIRSRVLRTSRHRTAYLEAGPSNGPLMFFLHGWPGSAIVWRRQVEYFAAAGWHCVAPDLRGFGGSAVPADPAAYGLRELVQDMVELHDSLGGRPAVWVGHDWGCAVVWAIASHHPVRCRAVANLTTPYLAEGLTLDNLVPLVNRDLYPTDQYPYGQWDYYVNYHENLERAVQDFEADTRASLNVIYQRTATDVVGRPSSLATVRARGGWFGPAHVAPTVPRDTSMLAEADFEALVAGYECTGFRGNVSLYLNDRANRIYAAEATRPVISLPALFVHARRDTVCDTSYSALADPMRKDCTDLSEVELDGGHTIMVELPDDTNAAISGWLRDVGCLPGS
ncbi:alpha/beta hydrolase [Actinoplanes sp. NPDC089786]|uniref:alpha/beta hydrolase n=1 Tax=Actinoplanes sp. NPDC089786 TaxID=3155185 RepID=UPI00342A4963